MTDKQIIIDGIDVSGCCFYEKHYTEDEDVEIKHFCKIFYYHCETEPNCYYKQLKRKEQECERLKKEREKKRDHYFMISNENARLEDEKSRLGYALNCKIEKLKQTLTEIKEIAETFSFTDNSELLLSRIEHILQKISEVE